MGKYNIGYTSGTFDLFHIGHLNILKKAKELCDYLIVGVYTDECVKKYKKVETVFTTEERAEIVAAVKYVDEVMIRGTRDKMDVWKLKKFDVLIIGDDWKNSPNWIKHEKDMAKVGGGRRLSSIYERHIHIHDKTKA